VSSPQPSEPDRSSDPLEVVEVERPEVVDSGRLRLLGFPAKPLNVAVTTFPLEVTTYHDVTALSLRDLAEPNRNVGAAYDRDGNLIAETQRAKPGRSWSPSPAELPVTNREPQRLAGRTFFAGRNAVHFGHILLETLTRFWPEVDYRAYDHFLTIPTHGTGSQGRRTLFGKLVLTARLPYARFAFALDQPIVCESLDVPSAPFHVAAAADPRFLNVFERIGRRVQRRQYHGSLSRLPRRVYFSRSRLKVKPRSADKRSADNEEEVEEMLARRGFQTVHTQELPLDEQVALARRAEIIAGCDGSALHLAMFSQPGTRMLALDTRRAPNQFLINRARGIDAVHVWAATEEVQNRMANWTINLNRVNEGLDLLLDDGA
jgi:capsular polysaccharide biosynthesis protein